MKHILLLGDGGVGKSTFAQYLKTKQFEKRYIPTVGIELHPFEKFTIVDTAGQKKYVGETPVRYFELFLPDIVLLMFSVDNKHSYINLQYWYDWIPEGIPVIIIGTKCDIDARKMYNENTLFHRYNNLPYFDVSSKTGYNIDKLGDYLDTLF